MPRVLSRNKFDTSQTCVQRSRYTHPALLQRDGIDARSVQKTPAGVSLIRRGLFFVKRQRRYAVYLQKTSRHEKVDSSDTPEKSVSGYRFQTVR